jgi:hypothetical protein
VDLVQLLLLSGLVREIGIVPEYVVPEFIDDDDDRAVAS